MVVVQEESLGVQDCNLAGTVLFYYRCQLEDTSARELGQLGLAASHAGAAA